MNWLWLAVLAGFFNALWTALSKPLLQGRSPREFTLIFRLLTCLFLLPLALAELPWDFPGAWWAWTAAAGVFEGLRIWLLASGVKHDYYATYAFYNLTPLFTVLAAPPLLGEPQPPSLLVGGALVSAGALLFHRLGGVSWTGLAGALLSTLGVVTAKFALNLAPAPFPFAFLSFGLGALVLLPLEAGEGQRIRMASVRRTWSRVVPVAFGSFLATVLFYLALAHEAASRVNPLVRANLLFGFLFSYFLLGERKGWRSRALAGGLILAGLCLILRP